MHLKQIPLLLIGVMSFTFLKAQVIAPMPDKKVIELTFSESGKLKLPPSSFALVEGNTYKVNLKIEKPEQQQKKLWKSIADKCKGTVDRLNDPEDSLSIRFEMVYSGAVLTDVKAEIMEMDTILRRSESRKE